MFLCYIITQTTNRGKERPHKYPMHANTENQLIYHQLFSQMFSTSFFFQQHYRALPHMEQTPLI